LHKRIFTLVDTKLFLLQGVSEKKLHKALHVINFVPFATESHWFRQNARQRLFLTTNHHKIYVNWLNILC